MWNCPGRDRIRGLMSVHELPSNACSTSFLKYCSVLWSSQTIFRLKISRSTLWPVSMNHRSKSVKPLNGFTLFWWPGRFSQGILWHSLFGRSFSHLMHLPQLCLYIHRPYTWHSGISRFGKVKTSLLFHWWHAVSSCLHVDIKWWYAPAACRVVDSLRHSNAEYRGTSR